MIIKEDLGDILKWPRKWLLPLNMVNCNALCLGGKNPKTTYNTAGNVLAKSDCSRDLGVLVTYNNLFWSYQVAKIVEKANTMLFCLRKIKAFPRLASKTFVKSILEIANSIWAPVLPCWSQFNVNQREFRSAKFVRNMLTDLY